MVSENFEDSEKVNVALSIEEVKEESSLCKTEIVKLNKRIKKLEVMSIISLILLVSILGVSLINIPNSNSEVVQTNTQKALPSKLNNAEIENLASEVVEAYNSKDLDRLYSTFGPFAQTMVTIEELEANLSQIMVLGTLEKYSYSHYDYLGDDDGADWYSLNYVAKYSAGNGTLKISIRVVDDKWEIVGFFFNIDHLDLEKIEN